MREIKFRAWNGSMIEYDVVVGRFGAFYGAGLDPKDSASFTPYNTIYSEQAPIMQYTGLKDGNDVEIYEGDILSHFDKKYIVKWDGYMAAFQASNPADGVDTDFFNWSHVPGLRTKGVPGVFSERDDPNCEVIGNIYENPELLEEV